MYSEYDILGSSDKGRKGKEYVEQTKKNKVQ